MTDQCINCTLKGDWKGCKATECYHHESWGWKQLESENKQQAARIDELESIAYDVVSVLTDSDYDALEELLYKAEKAVANTTPATQGEEVDEPEYIPVTIQQLIDVGLNGFAVQLLAKSINQNQVTKRISFSYKSVGISIVPLPQPPQGESK